MNGKLLLYIYILYIIIIIISNASVFFNFPYSISLSNGNILVIHKLGITICDSLLSKIIKEIVIFDEDEEINTESSLSKVTTATMDEYIIALINDKIYILNDVGDLLYENNTKILEQGETAEYYTLIPIKKEGNYLFYFIGFVHNASLYFLYYKYYNYEEKTNLILSKTRKKHEYGSTIYNIVNKGLTCQYMTYSQNINSIICFFLIYSNYYYYLTADNFLINNNNSIVQDSSYTGNHFNFPEIRCIKSCVAKDHSKALVGLYLTTGEARYFIFDINAIYYNTIQNWYFIDQHCRNQFHGLKINYYKEKEEYIYTCIDDNGKIYIEMYDKNFKNYNYTFKYTDCEEIYGYSIIYSIFKILIQ
jgi:hypothetical protein